MAHVGETTTAISQATGVSVQTVSHWRTRLARQGVQGLQEVARSGRPRRIGTAQRLELLSLACECPEPHGRGTPTLDELVERAVERGVVTQLSRSHLQRILHAGDLRPHRVRQWLHSPDPQSRQKVNAICALYGQAPKGSVVLSVDQKTGIQALQRRHADRASQPGRARRREFEPRHPGPHRCPGRALRARPGQLHGPAHPSRLVAFMGQVALAHPRGRVHIVWDNLNTHRAQSGWDDFNARHDHRFVFHFTPLHASWVNQIELLFGIYARRVLRHASHSSIAQLRERTEAFMAQRNQSPKPFEWTFAGFELQTGEPLRFKHDANVRSTKKGR